jgi:hypothetical protein
MHFAKSIGNNLPADLRSNEVTRQQMIGTTNAASQPNGRTLLA